MRACLWILLLLLAIPAAAPSADRAGSVREQAEILRSLRDRIDAATPAGTDLYRQYFEAFPASFADVRQMLATDQPPDVLLRSGEQWDFGQAYVEIMCRTYDYVDRRQYMRKLLHVGVGADDWGVHAKDRDYLYAGDIYLRLVNRYACPQSTDQQYREQIDAIYAVLPEFTDAQVAAIYNSLTWVEFDQKVRLDWFLNGICSLYPARCELTRTLQAAFPKQDKIGHH